MKYSYLRQSIKETAIEQDKIAIISGPRQVGKSTLAKTLISSKQNYFLYDDEKFMRAWKKSPNDSTIDREDGPIVLDEIHKDRAWKRRVKGIHDLSPGNPPIIVTGSARLEVYRKGSDSLLGRYIPFHLHPFSVAESDNPCTPDQILTEQKVNYPWEDIIKLGGFPEPLLKGRENFAKQWSKLRLDRIVLEDSRDLMAISDLDALRSLAILLPEKVGSLLSVNSLREDVGKAYATVRTWVKLLDALFYSFTIKPYSKKIQRAIRAEPKLYLFDILRIPEKDRSKRLENLTALHLKKACDYWTDTAQGDFELRFIRDKEKGEVDFLILRDSKPWMMIECKSSETELSPTLIKYKELLSPAIAVQLVDKKQYDRTFAAYGIRVIDYQQFFSGLI